MSEIDKKLAELVDYVVDIEPEGRLPSTIVKVKNNKVEVVREGNISKKIIEEKLKGVRK